MSVHMSALRYHFLVRVRLLNGMYLVIYSNVRSCYDNMPFVSFGLLVILSTSVAKIAYSSFSKLKLVRVGTFELIVEDVWLQAKTKGTSV